MKTASIYFAIIGNWLMLTSCSNRHYAFVQPSTSVRYYSVPDVPAQPHAIAETATATPPKLIASVANDLPQVATTATNTPATIRSEAPVTNNIRIANPSATSLHPVLSRREARQQLRAYAKEAHKVQRPADGSGTNGLAIAALVFGIVSLLILPILFGPLAVIFGAISMSQVKQRGERGYGMAVAGLVMGIIATVIVLIALAR